MKCYKVEYGMLVDTKENEILEHPYHSEYVDADIAQSLYDALKDSVEILEGILEDPEVLNVFKCHFDHQDLYEFQRTLSNADKD